MKLRAGCEQGGGGLDYSCYCSPGVFPYLIWRECVGEREGEMVAHTPTVYAQNAEFEIHPDEEECFATVTFH